MKRGWTALRGLFLPVSGKARIVQGPAGTLDLRFAHGVAQSRMRIDAPHLLAVDYTRSMLGALLWQPQPRRIAIVGLGGGSQAKFLHRHLPGAVIEVLEINPRVLALRDRFHVPPDDAGLRVLLVDAAEYLPTQRGRYDLLLVDGYDETGIPAALSTPAFHAACRDALAGKGVLATNLFCADHAAHYARLSEAFAGRTLLVEEPRQSNRVAFAWNGADAPRLHASEEVAALLPDDAAVQLRDGFNRVVEAMATRDA
jgi:spermidine synthase